MPDKRDTRRVQTSRNFPSRPLAAGLVLALAATSASVSTGAAATAPVQTAGGVRAALSAAPHAIAPSVKQTAISAVSAKQRASLASDLGITARPGATLVAHVRRPATSAFSMVGVTWKRSAASADVYAEIRTKTDGVWNGWTLLAWDEDGPSPREDSAATDGTSPLWVDSATGVEVAVYTTGRTPHGVKVSTINPGSSSYDALAASNEKRLLAKDANPEDGTFAGMPKVVTRDEWGADPKLGDACWDPKYGTTFKTVIVHHTAGSNDYKASEGPALVRGIYAYHTVSRHWCDIGYNFLIDRFGAIYEGRRGGMRLPVRGAHSGDYNVDTTGISLMGNFDIARPTRALKASLITLIAWRLGTAYHGAYGKSFIFDHKIKRISGHRDVMQTACPGRYVYAWLPRLREAVQTRLGDYVSPIEQGWRDLGGKNSDLGSVAVGERGEYGGHHTTFAHGRMFVSDKGLFTFYPGPVLHKYVAESGVAGDLGYPSSGVWNVPGGLGQAAEFSGGRIYWSSSTGAKMLQRGAILKRYIARGAAAHSRLGFPTSEVYTIDGGTRVAFENGTITYDASTHKTTISMRGA